MFAISLMLIDNIKRCTHSPFKEARLDWLDSLLMASLPIVRTFMKAVVLFILIAMVAGCALEQEMSRTPRTAVEQVLLTQAVEQALENLSVRLPEGVNVDVDATGLESGRSRLRMTNADLGAIDRPSRNILYIRDVVAAELGAERLPRLRPGH